MPIQLSFLYNNVSSLGLSLQFQAFGILLWDFLKQGIEVERFFFQRIDREMV
jgi:hypothetical protein